MLGNKYLGALVILLAISSSMNLYLISSTRIKNSESELEPHYLKIESFTSESIAKEINSGHSFNTITNCDDGTQTKQTDGSKPLSPDVFIPSTPTKYEVESERNLERVFEKTDGQVIQTQENVFTIKKDYLLEQINNLDNYNLSVVNSYEEGGLYIDRIYDGSPLENIGLRPGDAIQSINGEEVNGITDLMKLYMNLDSSDKFEVQIKRKGRIDYLFYNIDI